MLNEDLPVMDRIPVHTIESPGEWIEGELLIYNEAQTRAVYLNASAAVIWSLCDGKARVADIVETLRGLYPDAGATLKQEIIATVHELESKGVLVLQ